MPESASPLGRSTPSLCGPASGTLSCGPLPLPTIVVVVVAPLFYLGVPVREGGRGGEGGGEVCEVERHCLRDSDWEGWVCCVSMWNAFSIHI